MKKLFAALCACLALCALFALAAADAAPEIQYDKWNDFTHTYLNASGEEAEMQCSVYVPAAYAQQQTLPLITYIPDSSLVGKAMNTYKRAACPLNWAKEEKMAQNPALLLLIRISENSVTVTDDKTETGQLVPIIDSVVAQFGLDENRLYLTGQSMGGIMDFALNDQFPDKFAATVYVGCQMGDEVGDEQYNAVLASAQFAGQKFVYITSRKDGKAPFGQDDVEQALIDRGIEYGKLYDLDHQSETLNQQVKDVLDQGFAQTFFGFAQVTGTGDPAAEHMQSFKYAYAIDAIYDWLLAQSK
ncbi:MAG: PHB depolymerase family esterase [Clostridia bacterium]|nr:PHB depolymerase family esterase [Clostridia bacterium]